MNEELENEVCNSLNRIFKERLNLDFFQLQKKSRDIMDKNLFGKKILLAPRDLVYIYFDIERVFDISIPEEVIVSGRFHSFNNIKECIVHQKLTKVDENVYCSSN